MTTKTKDLLAILLVVLVWGVACNTLFPVFSFKIFLGGIAFSAFFSYLYSKLA